MRKTKLPTTHDQKCRQCKAIIIKSYDYFSGLYRWKCQGCGVERYQPDVRFKVQFQGADSIV